MPGNAFLKKRGRWGRSTGFRDRAFGLKSPPVLGTHALLWVLVQFVYQSTQRVVPTTAFFGDLTSPDQGAGLGALSGDRCAAQFQPRHASRSRALGPKVQPHLRRFPCAVRRAVTWHSGCCYIWATCERGDPMCFCHFGNGNGLAQDHVFGREGNW